MPYRKVCKAFFYNFENTTKMGYTFAGGYTTSSYKTKAIQIAKGSSENKTFYAKWSANTCTIRYHRNGGASGNMADTKSCKYGETYTLRANVFQCAGYQFSGGYLLRREPWYIRTK